MGQLPDLVRGGMRGDDLDDKTQESVGPLITHTNAGIDALAQALRGNLSQADNLQCEVLSFTASHGVAQTVALKKLKKANGIASWSVGGVTGGAMHALAAPPVLLQSGKTGSVQVLCYFMDSTAARVQMTLTVVPEGVGSSKTPNVGAKGSLLTSTGSAPAVLPVGTDAQVLTADSTQPDGIKWATASSGGGVTVAYEVDYSTLPTQDFKAGGDGNYTVDGKIMYMQGGAGATTFKLLNGTGLTATSAVGANPAIIGCNADAALGGGQTGVIQFIPTFQVGRTNVELWVRATHPSPMGSGASANRLTSGLYCRAPAVGLAGTTHGPNGNTWNIFDANNALQNAAGTSAGLNNTDDVLMCRVVGDAAYCYGGTWSGGWPSPNAMHFRGTTRGGGSAALNTAVNGFEGDLAMQIFNFVSFTTVGTVTLTNMRLVTY